MERAAGQPRDPCRAGIQDIVQRQQRAAAELDDHGFLDRRSALRGSLGPIWCMAVVVRPLHLATVFGFSCIGRPGPGCSLATFGARLEHAVSCGRCREEPLPQGILLLTT